MTVSQCTLEFDTEMLLQFPRPADFASYLLKQSLIAFGSGVKSYGVPKGQIYADRVDAVTYDGYNMHTYGMVMYLRDENDRYNGKVVIDGAIGAWMRSQIAEARYVQKYGKLG